MSGTPCFDGENQSAGTPRPTLDIGWRIEALFLIGLCQNLAYHLVGA